MYAMRTTAIDDRGVCLSICLHRSVTRLHCANAAERIKILLCVETLGDPRNTVLDGSPDFPTD